MFDPKCYELAEYFAPTAPSRMLEALAQDIQNAVEDFLRTAAPDTSEIPAKD